MQILDKQDGFRKYAGPGHWNDPDMMEIGNGGLSANENRAHFSIWAMLAAPLIAGNDLRNMSKETLAILTNKEVIAVNQDSLGVQGLKYSMQNSVASWLKPLKGGDWAVYFLNRSIASKKLDFAGYRIRKVLCLWQIPFNEVAEKGYLRKIKTK